jgi:hypothetical protein
MKLTKPQDMPSGGSQLSVWVFNLSEARAALAVAVRQLAPLAGSDPVERAAYAAQQETITPGAIVDAASAAITAEAVVVLAEQVNDLQRQVAELRAESAVESRG